MKFTKVAVLLAVFALATVPMFGQITSTPVATTPISVLRGESISLIVSTPLPQLTLAVGALTSDTQNVIVHSSWNLKQTRTNGVQICAYTNSALAGTGGNPDTIAIGDIYITPSSGPAVALGSGTACGVSGAVEYTSYVTATAAERKNFSGQDDTIPVYVQIPTDVAADTYTGTLNLIAYSN